jgi:hypothetical protein
MRITLPLLLLISAISFGWSAVLEPYKDGAAVAAAMALYPDEISDSRAAARKYWAVRDAELTPKFTLQDYGATAITLLAALLVLRVSYGVKSWSDFAALQTPNHRLKVLVLGAAAASVTTAAYVVSLLVDASRDAFPPWGDSLGIPFAGVPFIFVVLLSIAAVYGLVATATYCPSQRLGEAFRAKHKPNVFWLLFCGVPLVVSAVEVLTTAIGGDFVFLAPGLLWLFFFVILFGSKQRQANPRPEEARQVF